MTTPLWYSGAQQKPVQSYSKNSDGSPVVIGPTLGLILHVTTNWSDPYGFFSNPANQASSDWWCRKDGHLEQYVPANYRAWAQANGNGTYNSVETDGTPDVPLTDVECQEIAALYAWGHKVLGWPLQLAEKPGDRGFGWHGMGGAAWGGHYYCPGDKRKAQRQHILDLAAHLVGAAPAVAKPATVLTKVLAVVWPRVAVDGKFTASTVLSMQRTLKVKATGKFDLVTRRAMQAHLKVEVDGVVGPNTIRALQRRVHSQADGVWGTNTTRALQAALNNRTF